MSIKCIVDCSNHREKSTKHLKQKNKEDNHVSARV